MLETLADLHYSYLYEHDEVGSEVCFDSSKNLVALSLAVCTLVKQHLCCNMVTPVKLWLTCKTN